MLEAFTEEIQDEFDGFGDPKSNKKSLIRLLDGIEKARKALSADTEATLTVENIVGDEDFEREISRDEFDQMILS